MSKFLTELEIKCCLENENLWELEAPLLYKSDLLTDPTSSSSTSGLITVPKGFVTDLASTRHIPFVSMVWGSTAHREAVVHDYLYCLDSVPLVSFSMANAIFKEAMEARDKGFFTRYPMWLGVWIGGWWHFHKKSINWRPGDDPPVCIDPNSVITP
jgi:Protein of unknown function (DUF1353)